MKPLDEAMRRAAAEAESTWINSDSYSQHNEWPAVLKAALSSLAASGWVLVPRDTLDATKRQAIALVVGSCSCGMKSPNAALHPAECRYVTASGLLENIGEMLAAAPKTGETT